ncbi:MAG: DNA repair and recombination protein RadA [Candidatus Micrarchaeota archaeon]|nr:DNA repair and recombination protein RadA [Candidatus Micrarchaeota archaeon]MCX8154550.1 DNA repair and recombination protein RadA [Candidatus Micrarchaeota archaeon]
MKNLEDLKGVGPATAQKLRDAGYVSIEILASASPYEIAENTGLPIELCKSIVEQAKEEINVEIMSAYDIYQTRQSVSRITTGSQKLDELLGGGVETQSLVEFYGKFSSGKSQVGFQLSVNVQLPKNKGGLEGKVIFIDTESTFRPERIVEMAKHKGLDPEEVLRNIFVLKPQSSEEQIIAVEKLEYKLKEDNVKLIVVDSLTSHFRADFIGRGSLSDRQQKLNKHIHTLQRYAEKYNLAVYFTNQVMENPGIMFGDSITPIGGNVLAHAATYRVYVRKSKDDKRIARLVDSPNLPEREVIFRITSAGVTD